MRAGVPAVALALAAGCGAAGDPNQEDEPLLTGEETTISPRELDDEETAGELPEKEPVLQDETTER